MKSATIDDCIRKIEADSFRQGSFEIRIGIDRTKIRKLISQTFENCSVQSKWLGSHGYVEDGQDDAFVTDKYVEHLRERLWCCVEGCIGKCESAIMTQHLK